MVHTAHPTPGGSADPSPDPRTGGRDIERGDGRPDGRPRRAAGDPGGWTFLTNHARVLAAVARDPGARIRDLAVGCLLTERAVQKVLVDLESAGYIAHIRTGRRNTYRVTPGTKVAKPVTATSSRGGGS